MSNPHATQACAQDWTLTQTTFLQALLTEIRAELWLTEAIQIQLHCCAYSWKDTIVD